MQETTNAQCMASVPIRKGSRLPIRAGLAIALVGLLASILSMAGLPPRARAPAPATAMTPNGMRELPDPLYGVTIDDVSGLQSTIVALHQLAHMPTARIVFDPQNGPAYYAPAIAQIQPVSYIMGTLLDSSNMADISTSDYAQRTADYLGAFGDKVDLWEIGNEINGEWLCPSKACTNEETSDVVAKMSQAYDIVHNAGKRTALTLYYNGLDETNTCADIPANRMFPWAEENIPERMKQGLDYVFISYYEQDCPGVSKDWQDVFSRLHLLFPSSKIGFGENGTTKPSAPIVLKQQYMDEYYLQDVNVPGYVHGHFWWNFREDCVPISNPLWARLNVDFIGMPITSLPTLPIRRYKRVGN